MIVAKINLKYPEEFPMPQSHTITRQFMGLFSLFGLALLLILTPQPSQAQDEYTAYWDGQTRFTVLIMGMDRRPSEHNTLQVRTDAIMIASYDPATQQLGILSIPRDMHFSLVENGELARVNTLVLRGENIQEGYGPIYAMDTLQYNFGFYIDAYMLFDFEAFITVVDAIGGITIDVPLAIYDQEFPDMDYGFDPFEVERGVQDFDGYDALRYARTRHGDNDYLRGQRQLAVLEAIYAKLQQPDTLNGVIDDIPSLLDQLSNNFYTNIAIEDGVRLGIELANLTFDDVHTGALNQAYSLQVNQGRETSRVPDRALLPELLIEVFGENYSG
ncbi:MAG: hypothetical protein CL607_11430 [Anaerolineaceae bacterium]|nr:hypothetical protein [Anaerolineaceae bacterium]